MLKVFSLKPSAYVRCELVETSFLQTLQPMRTVRNLFSLDPPPCGNWLKPLFFRLTSLWEQVETYFFQTTSLYELVETSFAEISLISLSLAVREADASRHKIDSIDLPRYHTDI